jgi:hypothetical protein
MNPFVTDASWNYRFSSVPYPKRKIFVAEIVEQDTEWAITSDNQLPSPVSAAGVTMAYRHRAPDLSNVLMVDGSAVTLSREELTLNPPGIESYWTW